MKKKILSILITILALCTCMFTLTACGENEPPHTHTYSVLKYDTENHWHECSCGEKKDIEKHKGGTATETNKATCSVCNQEYGESLGHVHTLHLTKVNAKPQSCTEEGNREYYTCSCGKWFADNTATTEITDKTSVVIEKDDHEYETLNKTATQHWWECSCGDKDGLEEHHGGNATCTEKAVCDDCGIEYGSKKSHSYIMLKQSATQHWYECICGAYEIKENHNPGAEATETTDQKCTECQYVIAPALGHVHTLHLTKVDAKPQSCTQEGNKEYYTCSCGKWFTNNSATTEITDKTSVVIAKDAHKYTVVSDEHDNLSSIKSSKDFTQNSQQIKIKKGVYIFIVAKNIEKFNLKKFNKIDCSNVPPLGKWIKDENIKVFSLNKGQIFYIGSNEKDCTGRCFQHINCDKKSGNDNLRLEYRKRKFIKKFLKVMFISCDVL